MTKIGIWYLQHQIHTLILLTNSIASPKSTAFFSGRVILYPLGKKVLNPKSKSSYPLNNSLTLAMTPLVSTLKKQQNTPIKTKHISCCKTRKTKNGRDKKGIYLPLSFKVLHDFKESVILVFLVLKHIFDSFEVAQGVTCCQPSSHVSSSTNRQRLAISAITQTYLK